MKFKVGDKVEIVRPLYGEAVGTITNILEIDHSDDTYMVSGKNTDEGFKVVYYSAINLRPILLQGDAVDELIKENPDLIERLAKEETKDLTGAAKNDKADLKPDYSMIPKVVMDQLSYVMMAGAEKYGTFNYTKGHNITQLTAAVCRHAKQIEAGEDIDKDTSDRLGKDIYHWACIMASGLMALHQMELGTLKDDRFKPPLLEFEE